jgi:hypothetical protein
MVAKGLVIEVEDRGLGMSEEDYASLNEQLAVAPQFDVVALADDLRLGMFVIARLATRHGIAVTLRSSPYGGTTAIVLVPHEIVVPEAPEESSPGASPAVDADDAAGVTEAVLAKKAAALAERAAGAPSPAPGGLPGIPPARSPEPSVTADPGGLTPLPRRVPQTSLASELREEAGAVEEDTELEDFTAERAASSLAGFQRGTFQARDEDAPSQYDREETAASSNPPADRS